MKIAILIGLAVLAGVVVLSSSTSLTTAAKVDYGISNKNNSVNISPPTFSEDTSTQGYEVQAPTFNGYICTQDCSGHSAGYDWAEENGITQDDVDSYSGNSDSFREGMQSYVDEQESNNDYDDYDSGF